MTPTALSSPPTPDRAADVRRAAIDRAPGPDPECHDGRDLRPTHAAMRFVILADGRGGSIARRGSFEGTGGRTPAEGQVDARVIIIGCEHRLFVHTRSKNWAMTVRQIGWLIVHPSPGQKTETMIPYVASRVRSWPRAAVTRRERRQGIPSWVPLSDRGRGRPRRRALTVAQAMVGRLEDQTNPRRPGRRIDQTSAGSWFAGSPLCVSVTRGVRYNWKGPPTLLPLRAPGSPPGQGHMQFRVH
jgi:hypothetical protein